MGNGDVKEAKRTQMLWQLQPLKAATGSGSVWLSQLLSSSKQKKHLLCSNASICKMGSESNKLKAGSW